MRPVITSIGLALLLSSVVWGQAPRFAITDIHPSAPVATASMRSARIRSGVYQIQLATMADLIATAYGVDVEKVLDGPSWLELDRFDILAKVPPGTSADTTRLMLQALLADRFKLVIHKDSRALPAIALTVRKGVTPKLKPSDGFNKSVCKLDVVNVVPQAFWYTCQNITMAAFAESLRRRAGTPPNVENDAVVDQTGLKGVWDFAFHYTQTPAAGAASPGDAESITISEALENQLGLRLAAASIPTPVIVVDHVNRLPTDNLPDVKTIRPPTPPAAFEVASMRLSEPGAPEVRSAGPLPGGRFEVRNFPLTFLIRLAWNLTNVDLTGAPAWLNGVRVDVSAKLPETDATREISGVTDMDTFAPALQALLIDRFKVAIHTEQRLLPGYVLLSAKPKLQRATPSERTKCKEGPAAGAKDPRASNPLLSRLITCQNMTMREFAERLPTLSGGYVRGDIADETGVTGAYNFTVSFSGKNQLALAAADGSISLFDALETQLGLKLEMRNMPTPVVVLDHIDQRPTDN